MTDNRFNFCGFPPKLVKFAESAYRASALQQKKRKRRFVLWSFSPCQTNLTFFPANYFWSLAHISVRMIYFPKETFFCILFSPFFLRIDLFLTYIESVWQLVLISDIDNFELRIIRSTDPDPDPPPPRAPQEQPLSNPPSQWKGSAKSTLN